MVDLFSKTIDFNDDVYRNIVSLREARDLFADLSDGDATMSGLAIQAEMRVKEDLPRGFLDRGFHYTVGAISYPFESEPYLSTRFGNGQYGVWYGSLELDTTIFETAHHMMVEESKVDGLEEPIIRERAVYLVGCRALLIDLRGKEKDYHWLVTDDYSMTQTIGARLQKEGHPGLLTPSARCQGTNLVAFSSRVLSNQRNHCYLIYTLDPVSKSMVVERQRGEVLFKIDY